MKNPECPDCSAKNVRNELSAGMNRRNPIFECDECGYWRYMTENERLSRWYKK